MLHHCACAKTALCRSVPANGSRAAASGRMRSTPSPPQGKEMICKHCGSSEAVVLETRPYIQKSFFIKKRRHICPNGHRFNSIEVPEEVFLCQKSRILARLEQFERGMEQRVLRSKQRATIDKGLDLGGKYEYIASLAGCSKSLVEKRARERRLFKPHDVHTDS